MSLQLGDQSASMWGSCCFNTGDIKITLGTGSFLNLNTGSQCPASIYGLYPLVAWRYNDKQSNNNELIYCMEGAANDTGSIIQWAMNFGLFEDPSKSAEIANSVDDTEDVYFVPAFSGLGVCYQYLIYSILSVAIILFTIKFVIMPYLKRMHI